MQKEGKRSRYLIKNTAVFAIGNLSTKLIHFFLVPIYTYVLTTSDYGTIDLVFAFCSILSPVVMCNIGEAVRRYSLDADADNYAILSIAFMWVGIGIVFTMILAPLFRLYEPISTFTLQMMIYIILYAAYTVFLEYLRGREQFVKYTICSIFTTFAIAVLNIIFLVYLKLGINGYFIAYIVGYGLSILLAIIMGKPYVVFGHWKWDKALFMQMSKFAILLVPNSLLWWVINSSDRIMVSEMIGVSANGIFTVAYKLPSLMTTAGTIAMQAWQYSAIKVNQSDDRTEYNNRMFDMYFRIIIIMAAALMLIVKPTLKIYVSPDFYSAWRYCPFLILGFVFMTLATFVGTSYYVEKDMKGNLSSAVVGAVANIVFNFTLIPLIGITGATIASCVSYICILVYRLKDTRKYIPIYILKREYILNFIILGCMVWIYYIEPVYHYLIMIGEMVLILLLNRSFIKEIFKNLVKRKA